ncbi:Transcription factor HBP-1b(c1) [Capsicum annuum]|nr:Transcription factor HBP-1b(c1) [Capsicum annuum]
MNPLLPFWLYSWLSIPMFRGTEGNNTNTSRMSEFGVLEQYLGFRIGDGSNANRSPLFNSTSATNPAVGFDVSGTINRNLAPSNTSLSAAAPGSQILQLQSSVVPVSSNPENWGESNLADSGSRTDTSTDMDGDDRNQRQGDKGGDKKLYRLVKTREWKARDLDQVKCINDEDGKIETGQSRTIAASDSSDKSKEKVLDQKAYVQQLENSRLKLSQLEQDLQRARQQGKYISNMGDQSNGVGASGTLAFDAEYSRWLEEHNKHINELRNAVNSHASDPELRSIVNNVTAHFDEVFRVKGNAAKADVFHVLSGMWKTPAERCFMWIGGFRPSELLKLLVTQLEPLTEQQLAGIYNLQQSSHQAEDALSQGMEQLQQSLAETLANGSPATEGSSGDVANYMGQMAMAMGKLGTLDGFLRQADSLRQQTLQQMHRILTTRQSARALLAINEYFSRLRALSSLWLARPREQ